MALTKSRRKAIRRRHHVISISIIGRMYDSIPETGSEPFARDTETNHSSHSDALLLHERRTRDASPCGFLSPYLLAAANPRVRMPANPRVRLPNSSVTTEALARFNWSWRERGLRGRFPRPLSKRTTGRGALALLAASFDVCA